MENKSIENWDVMKSRLKKDYPHLTEEDLVYETGKEAELVKRLQKKMNKNEHEIRKWLRLMG